MIRRIIEIDEDKCNGCGLCADACHEDAIGMVDGKESINLSVDVISYGADKVYIDNVLELSSVLGLYTKI